MSSTLEARSPRAAPPELSSLVGPFAPAERAIIERAASVAAASSESARTPEGEPLARHAFGVAGILSALKLDHESVTAALLLGQAPSAEDIELLRERFGASVAMLVDGVARMSQIHNEAVAVNPQERAAQAERLRKMLLAMVEDIRIVLIKLAERMQTMRWVVTADEHVRRDTAREVLELFAPLANRLGVWQIKWELEDLSLRASRTRPSRGRSTSGGTIARRTSAR